MEGEGCYVHGAPMVTMTMGEEQVQFPQKPYPIPDQKGEKNLPFKPAHVHWLI